MSAETLVRIEIEADIVEARRQGRAIATSAGINGTELTLVATAISEVARNILSYATRGEVALLEVSDGTRRGLRVIARDQGPGIADIARAMEDGFSTGHGLGLGLPGAKRLMDDFTIESVVGRGTTVTMTKWAR